MVPFAFMKVLGQVVESCFPQRSIDVKPPGHVAHRPGGQSALANAPHLARLDQPGPLEHGDVLEDGGGRDVAAGGQAAEGNAAAGQPFDDVTPRRIGQRRKRAIEVCDVT